MEEEERATGGGSGTLLLHETVLAGRVPNHKA